MVLPEDKADLQKLVVHLQAHLEQLVNSTALVIVVASAAYLDLKGLPWMIQNRLVDFYPDSIPQADLNTLIAVLTSPPDTETSATPAEQSSDLGKLGLLDYHRGTEFLHNPESGRLDIGVVAELFGITVSELARLVGVEGKTALKTPDSKTLHEGLLPYEQIAGALDLLESDPGKFRQWLNSSNNELQGQTPMQVIQAGKAKNLAGLVQSALLGQPN